MEVIDLYFQAYLFPNIMHFCCSVIRVNYCTEFLAGQHFPLSYVPH